MNRSSPIWLGAALLLVASTTSTAKAEQRWFEVEPGVRVRVNVLNRNYEVNQFAPCRYNFNVKDSLNSKYKCFS